MLRPTGGWSGFRVPQGCSCPTAVLDSCVPCADVCFCLCRCCCCCCRIGESHLGELLEYAPRDELQSILALVCNMFHVNNALVALFFDRRVYIIDGTGAFAVSRLPLSSYRCAACSMA